MDKTSGIFRGLLWAASLLGVIAGMSGCTRNFYRQAADREVNDILAEKDKYPQWKIEQWHVYADKRARFADPTNPDRPPMPPDDEAAWQMSPHPQKPGHHGGTSDLWGTGYLEMIKAWDAENLAERQAAAGGAAKPVGPPGKAKNPIKAFMDEPLYAEQRGFLLKLDQAIELGVINSPQYERFREELYLAALPVTQQRYGFAYQWAATADWIREWAGPQSSRGRQNSWTGNSTIGFNKLFATGALLSADFVNTTAFNFTGATHGMTSGSVINLNLAQPLLQGGGKAVTLEPLTQSERTLFYSIRAYARFREQFNVGIAIGASLPGSLQLAAGTSTAGSPISVLAALGIASTDVSGGFVGYLSVLFRECDMAADQKWHYDLGAFLKTLEAYQEGGFYSPLQVDQARSTFLQAQNTVLADQQFVSNGLDQFKLLLGLPANIPLILDDAPARPITRLYDQYYGVIADSSVASRAVEKKEKQELLPAKEMRDFLLDMFSNEAKNPLVRGTAFQKQTPVSWKEWRETKAKDFQTRMEKFSKDRRDLLDLKTDQELKGEVFSAENERKLRAASFEYDLGAFEKELRNYDVEPWKKLPEKEKRPDGSFRFSAGDKQIEMARLVVQKAKDVLVYARNERFEDAGQHWPDVPPALLDQLNLVTADVDQAQEAAVQAALQNRLDLMNARAQVVDAWRQLKVTANALMGVATVQYNLLSQTAPGGVRPLAFSAAATDQQLKLDFQLPLNRLAQRNNYRAAQINYQVARRSLMILEDSIAAQVRFDVRQLQLFAANYRIQSKVIHSLYKQVDSALDVIVAPTDPDALKGSGTSVQANAAALTSQYLGALGGLNNAQVKMYDIWLSLYATRMQLYLDLDRLPLDLRGVWVDEAAVFSPAVKAEGPSQSNRDVNRAAAQPATPTVLPAANSEGATVGRPVFLPPYVLRSDHGGATGRP
jgi:Outer membrane efflux protein